MTELESVRSTQINENSVITVNHHDGKTGRGLFNPGGHNLKLDDNKKHQNNKPGSAKHNMTGDKS